MRVIVFDGIGNPIIVNATRIVVTDDNGTPVSASVQSHTGDIRTNHVDDGPSFQKMLHDCGIHQTVVVEHLRVPTLEDFKI